MTIYKKQDFDVLYNQIKEIMKKIDEMKNDCDHQEIITEQKTGHYNFEYGTYISTIKKCAICGKVLDYKTS